MIVELAERSPIIIKNGNSNPSSRKKFGLTTVRPTVQGATFNMRGQLYRGHANATALSSSPVVSALGSESDDPGSSPGRGKALCPWDVREKKRELRFKAWLNLYSTSSVKTNRRADVIRFTVFVTLSRPYATGNVSIRFHLPRIYFKRFPLNKNSIFLNCTN